MRGEFGEPKAIVRDPQVNRCIELPIIGRKGFVEGTAPPRREFPFLVGQPEPVRRAYDEALGIDTPRIWTAARDKDMWASLQG